jgi:glutamine synthetase
MTAPIPDFSQLLERAARSGVRFIDLQFTDLAGAVKGLTIPASELPRALSQGVWFDGSSLEGGARLAESDLCLAPDPTTFSVVPWLTGPQATGRLVCHVRLVSGEPYAGDPRSALVRVLAGAAAMGFVYEASPEVEFFVLKRGADGSLAPQASDHGGYFDVPDGRTETWLPQVVTALGALGIAIDSLHHEAAPGQYEIDFRRSSALQTADNLATFRFVLKTIAQQHGLQATLLPKPMLGLSGSGMHVHQTLAYRSGGQNAFYDPGDPYGLSQTARHFIAGQLAHAAAMCAVLAPLVNSYKRLGAGHEAPVRIGWARINRAALVRIPRAPVPQAARVELRCPDSGCNPYLALAVMLAAGLDGLRRRLPAPPVSDENLFRRAPARPPERDALPGSLEAALAALEADPVIREALGEPLYQRFVAARRLDVAQYRQAVSSGEVRGAGV